ARESRSVDGEDHRGQTVPTGDSRHGKQGSPGRLGYPDQETGVPAASVLNALTASEMQDVEVMMRT
ncbi:MAG: hypothetical protein AAF066_18405, partial [Pseudomonadota bacterium]